MTEVPYKGSLAAHPDLIAKRITHMIEPFAGTVRPIPASENQPLGHATGQKPIAIAITPVRHDQATSKASDFATTCR